MALVKIICFIALLPPILTISMDEEQKSLVEVLTRIHKNVDTAEKELEKIIASKLEHKHDVVERILEANQNTGRELTFGDMVYNKEQQQVHNQAIQGDIVKETSRHWDTKFIENGVECIKIPYMFGPKVTASIKTAAAEAINEFTTKTCIRFVPKQTELDYLLIMNEVGCWGFVGKQSGMQILSIQADKCDNKGTAIHVLMHAIGFFHEQSRPDRDSYVKINTENVKDGFLGEYQIEDSDNQGTAYDYKSIMHYGAYAFSKNGLPTMERINGPNKLDLGSDDGFSESDLLSIMKTYCGLKEQRIEEASTTPVPVTTAPPTTMTTATTTTPTTTTPTTTTPTTTPTTTTTTPTTTTPTTTPTTTTTTSTTTTPTTTPTTTTPTTTPATTTPTTTPTTTTTTPKTTTPTTTPTTTTTTSTTTTPTTTPTTTTPTTTPTTTTNTSITSQSTTLTIPTATSTTPITITIKPPECGQWPDDKMFCRYVSRSGLCQFCLYSQHCSKECSREKKRKRCQRKAKLGFCLHTNARKRNWMARFCSKSCQADYCTGKPTITPGAKSPCGVWPEDPNFCNIVAKSGLCRFCAYNKQCANTCTDRKNRRVCESRMRRGYCVEKQRHRHRGFWMSRNCAGSCRDEFCTSQGFPKTEN